MCYLLLHHRVRDDHPLVLLANRDEFFDRPFEGPALRDGELGIVAPRDLRAGGTWLGVNAAGLVAAITNRRGPEPEGDLRSRGLLVSDVLAHGDVKTASVWVQEHLHETPYAAFNLLLADGTDACVVRHDPCEEGRPRDGVLLPLAPGVHTITNLHELDEVGPPADGLPVVDEPLAATLMRLEILARDETTVLPGDHRILKRGAERGTVCSALIAQPADDVQARVFRFADGVPGEVPFVEVEASA
ncbi:MAG: NRDE family protein [Planctomycetota bacterium]|nr:NRDE family protein [Planctomycetota bacterium]